MLCNLACLAKLEEDMELDAVSRQFNPYLTHCCVCTGLFGIFFSPPLAA